MMTPQDTAAVLAYFSSAWPKAEITEQTAAVWAETCTDLDPADARQAMYQLVRSEHWFPSIARFRQQVQAIAYDRRHRSTDAAIGSGAPLPWPTELVAAIKATIANQGPRRHWHGGPDPCPVCGGMIPKNWPRGKGLAA